MRMIVAAGGTGGHIFPALAVADGIMERNKSSEILFIGAKGKMEEKIIPDAGYNIKTIDIIGIDRKNIFKNIKFAFKYYKAVKYCSEIMEIFKPQIVFGTGGFVSGPAFRSAYKKKIPFVVQEGNSYPGKVVRYFSDKAASVIVNFDETKKYLKQNSKVINISYPVRSKLRKYDKKIAATEMGLKNWGKVIFVFGGSQGSRSINKVVEKNLADMISDNISIIWQTGNTDFNKIKLYEEKYKGHVVVYSFINKMDFAYSACDLAVCRAGISSIMELSLLKIPSLLIPYPYAAENHQLKNALSLFERGAAEMIEEKDLNNLFLDKIKDLFTNKDKLNMLSEKIGDIYDKGAVEKIINCLTQHIK